MTTNTFKLTDTDGAVTRLSQLIKLRTVSDSQADGHIRQPDQFHLAHKHLKASYPEIYKHMTVETVKTP